MKIVYVSPSPFAGQTAHLQPLRAQGLIDAGFAVEVPMPRRGCSGWLAAMQEQEAERQKLLPADQQQNCPAVPTWGVRFLEQSRKYVVVMNHLTSEVIYGEVVLLKRGLKPTNLDRYRRVTYQLGFWFSVLLPFGVPALLLLNPSGVGGP
jgi:hypothetical protein